MKIYSFALAKTALVLGAVSSIISGAGLAWATNREYVLHSRPYAAPYHFEQPNIGSAQGYCTALAVSLLVSVIAYYIAVNLKQKIR